MYLVGSEHPHRTESQILAERLIAEGQHLVTDAEVLQEILHRFTAIDRRNTIGRAFQALLDIVDDVFAVEKPTCCAPLRSHRIEPLFPPGTQSTSPSWSTTVFNRFCALTPISTAGRV